jgi:hypothetical protein
MASFAVVLALQKVFLWLFLGVDLCFYGCFWSFFTFPFMVCVGGYGGCWVPWAEGGFFGWHRSVGGCGSCGLAGFGVEMG